MANGIVITFFILLGILAMVGLIILIVKVSKKIRPDVPPNSNLIISLDKQTTRGYMVGVKMTPDNDVLHNKNSNSELIRMRPISVPYDKEGKPVDVEPIRFAVRRNLILKCSAGTVDDYRSIDIIFPSSSAQLDSSLLETPFGQVLGKAIESMNDKDNTLSIIRKSNIKRKMEQDLLDETQDKVIGYQQGALRELFEQRTKEKKESM